MNDKLCICLHSWQCPTASYQRPSLGSGLTGSNGRLGTPLQQSAKPLAYFEQSGVGAFWASKKLGKAWVDCIPKIANATNRTIFWSKNIVIRIILDEWDTVTGKWKIFQSPAMPRRQRGNDQIIYAEAQWKRKIKAWLPRMIIYSQVVRRSHAQSGFNFFYA